MPNYCHFDMRVIGEEGAVRDFHDMLLNYDRDRHFWRVFEAEIYSEEVLADGRLRVDIFGYCAWSAHSCMRDGFATYASDYPEKSTSLQEQSLLKGLQIEVFSTEDGIGFAEHFLYVDGEELADECVDYEEYYFGNDEFSRELFEELQARGAMPEQELFEEWVGENYAVGGFGDYAFSIPMAA